MIRCKKCGSPNETPGSPKSLTTAIRNGCRALPGERDFTVADFEIIRKHVADFVANSIADLTLDQDDNGLRLLEIVFERLTGETLHGKK